MTTLFISILATFIFTGLLAWLLHQHRMSSLHQIVIRENTLLASATARYQALVEAHTQLQAKMDALLADNIALKEEISRYTTQLAEERRQSSEKLALLDTAKQQFKAEFQNLAQHILEEKSQRFTEQNKTNLDGLLGPLREQIKDFEKKIADTYEKESKDRIALTYEIQHLKTLNKQMSEDAVQLTQALKGNAKTQGTWGEMILERVLEKSGLVKGREYTVQVRLEDESKKNYQPDVIVHLPDQKDIIIDAKVSLIAYERYCAASDDETRRMALKDHMLSLENHVRQLSSKEYHKLNNVRTLDFVLLFIPIESAFMVAMQHESQLFTDALQDNIVIVTPTTLLATLRTIQNLWRFEYQNRNAAKIAQKAGDLYDKFVGFVDDIKKVGEKIAATQEIYDMAYAKLSSGRGNLIKRAADIRELGVHTQKRLSTDEYEEDGENEEIPALINEKENV